MRAMVLTAPGELVQDELARPTAGAGQVLVRVTHSGICGTDYKIFNGSIPVRYPRVMGHEMVGEVADPGDTTLRPGDRVIVDPELYCGACFHCRIGKTHLCPNGSLLGRDANGGEWVFTSPAANVYARTAIKVDAIEGEKVYYTKGPAAGTKVVTMGAAELYGIEFGVGK